MQPTAARSPCRSNLASHPPRIICWLYPFQVRLREVCCESSKPPTSRQNVPPSATIHNLRSIGSPSAAGPCTQKASGGRVSRRVTGQLLTPHQLAVSVIGLYLTFVSMLIPGSQGPLANYLPEPHVEYPNRAAERASSLPYLAACSRDVSGTYRTFAPVLGTYARA